MRMRALADALGILQEPGGYLKRTTRLLAIVGGITGADRAYYFKHNLDTDPPTCSQRCEWVRDGISREIHNQTLQCISYESVLPGALALLSVGSPFAVVTPNAPMPLKQILGEQGIKSLVLVPMLAGSTLLGFIGLDDCRSERSLSSEELDLLRAAASGLAGALLRARVEAKGSARSAEVGRGRPQPPDLPQPHGRCPARGRRRRGSKPRQIGFSGDDEPRDPDSAQRGDRVHRASPWRGPPPPAGRDARHNSKLWGIAPGTDQRYPRPLENRVRQAGV